MVLGFLPTGCAISARSGGSPAPEALQGQPGSPMLVEFRGKGSSCLLSLSALVLPAVWMVLPSPAPVLWGPFVSSYFLFFIKAPGPVPTPHPRTAVNLSVVKIAAALLPASTSAVSLIKRGGLSLPLIRLVLWEDSGMGRWVEIVWAPGCGTLGTWTLPQVPLWDSPPPPGAWGSPPPRGSLAAVA